MFRPIAHRLVRELAPRAGERALDVGCGRGAVLLPLAEATGPSGLAVGIDLSPRMVELAREAVTSTSPRTEVRLGDAQAPELPHASFDIITASLVLFFLPDPLAAVRSWRELLVSRGRLGISTFGELSECWKPVDMVFAPYVPSALRDARTSGARGPFASDAGVEGLLAEGGFTLLRTVSMDLDVRFDDEEHWLRWSWSVGQRAMWEFVPEADRLAVRREAFERLDDCRDESGRIGFGQRVRFTLGVRAE